MVATSNAALSRRRLPMALGLPDGVLCAPRSAERTAQALDAVFDAWAKGSGCAARSQCLGSLEAWRRSDGSWDLGAADRDILLGKGVVLGGFVGLAVIDFVALSALVFFAKTILFAES